MRDALKLRPPDGEDEGESEADSASARALYAEYAALSAHDEGDRRRRFALGARLFGAAVVGGDVSHAKRLALVAEDLYDALFEHGLPADAGSAEGALALGTYLLSTRDGSRAWQVVAASEKTLDRFLPASAPLSLLRARLLARELRFVEAYAALAPALTAKVPEAIELALFLARSVGQPSELDALAARFPGDEATAWHEALRAFQRGQGGGTLASGLRRETFRATPERKLKAWLYVVASGERAVADLMQSPKNVKRHHIRVKNATGEALALVAAAETVERLVEGDLPNPFRAYDALRAELKGGGDPEVALLFDAAVAAVSAVAYPSLSREARAAYEANSLVASGGGLRDVLLLTALFDANAAGEAGADTFSAKATRKSRPLLSASLGVSSRIAGLKLRSLFLTRVAQEELRQTTIVECVRLVAEHGSVSHGAMQKFVQLASCLDVFVPDDLKMPLLASEAPRHHASAAQVEAELRRSLGKGSTELFEAFEPRPFACGSIGQVHRAVTKGGEAVAVKVQYPGIGEQLSREMRAMTELSWLFDALLTGTSVRPALKQWRALTLAQCDYDRERAMQSQAHALLQAAAASGAPRAPRVIPELSGGNVITQSFVRGQSLGAFIANSTQAGRDAVGAQIVRGTFALIEAGVFYGDFHPGNFLVAYEGDAPVVHVVDFGACIPLPATAGGFRAFLRAVVDGDRRGMESFLVGSKFYGEGLPAAHLEKVAGLYRSVYLRPFVDTAPFRFTPDFARDVARTYWREEFRSGVLALPDDPELLFLRFYLSLYSLLGLLRAEGSWSKLVGAKTA